MVLSSENNGGRKVNGREVRREDGKEEGEGREGGKKGRKRGEGKEAAGKK